MNSEYPKAPNHELQPHTSRGSATHVFFAESQVSKLKKKIVCERCHQQRAPTLCSELSSMQLVTVRQLDSSKLAILMTNTTTHYRHLEHRIVDQELTSTLLFSNISLHPTRPSTLFLSVTVMAHPAHLLITWYASSRSCKCEGTLVVRFPVGAR